MNVKLCNNHKTFDNTSESPCLLLETRCVTPILRQNCISYSLKLLSTKTQMFVVCLQGEEAGVLLFQTNATIYTAPSDGPTGFVRCMKQQFKATFGCFCHLSCADWSIQSTQNFPCYCYYYFLLQTFEFLKHSDVKLCPEMGVKPVVSWAGRENSQLTIS